ncbi:MAG: metallopeptidase family protein [Myxococcota bacterium]
MPHPADLKRAQPPVPPTSLGMFVGVTSLESTIGDAVPQQRPAILLFKRNLERAFPDRQQMVQELGRTINQEVGRALGISPVELCPPDDSVD